MWCPWLLTDMFSRCPHFIRGRRELPCLLVTAEAVGGARAAAGGRAAGAKLRLSSAEGVVTANERLLSCVETRRKFPFMKSATSRSVGHTRAPANFWAPRLSTFSPPRPPSILWMAYIQYVEVLNGMDGWRHLRSWRCLDTNFIQIYVSQVLPAN